MWAGNKTIVSLNRTKDLHRCWKAHYLRLLFGDCLWNNWHKCYQND